MSPTATSAPGKVLLAGGYLVLDRAYTGLVFGLSARIHVIIEEVQTSDGVELSEISVRSPQFREAIWGYGYAVLGKDGKGERDAGMSVVPLRGSSKILNRNPFVEITLIYVLTYISTVLPASTRLSPSNITILADNAYYSQPTSTTPNASHLQQPTASNHKSSFTNYPYTLSSAHKTGLGSSAALVTSLTCSLLMHYLPASQFSLHNPTGRSILHNLAQAAHCAAQGKVGSGFDVAAAVYGTCVYRRFSPHVLAGLGEPGSEGFASRVKYVVEDGGGNAGKVWDTQVVKERVTIPKGYALLMCDVDCGSQTVGMVKGVLEWTKKEAVDAKSIWDELQQKNEGLAALLSSANIDESALSQAFEQIRALIRDMGQKAGVPIEPREQTELLDGLIREVEGVIGGVVPGAGGYDAMVVLVREGDETIKAVERFLENWTRAAKGNVKLLGVKGDLEGTRTEDVGRYTPWV